MANLPSSSHFEVLSHTFDAINIQEISINDTIHQTTDSNHSVCYTCTEVSTIRQLHRIEQGEPAGEKTWDLEAGGAYENVGVVQTASAKGAKLLLLKVRSPSRLGGLEERSKLPQRGLGQSPRNRSDFEHFMPKLGTFWDLVSLRLFNNQIQK